MKPAVATTISIVALLALGLALWLAHNATDQEQKDRDAVAPSKAAIPAFEKPPTVDAAAGIEEEDLAEIFEMLPPQMRAEYREPGTAEVAFPDGEIVAINYRRRPDPFQIPNIAGLELDLVDSYSMLTAAVDAGDGGAAFRQWELLSYCDDWLNAEDGLESTVVGIHQEGSYTNPFHASGSLEHFEKISLAEAAARRHYGERQELVATHMSTHDDLLMQAMELGNSQAMKNYGYKAGRTASAVRAFEQAWLSGDLFAIHWLAYLNRYGWTDEMGQITGGPVQTYAYQLLFTTLWELQYLDPEEIDDSLIDRNRRELAADEQLLMPEDRERAISMAKQLLKANTNCCMY